MLCIILNEIRSYYRNGSNLFFTILFPSICVFFLGTFIGALSNQADKPVGDLSVCYCVSNADEMSSAAFERFLASLEDNNILSAERKASFDGIPDGCDAFFELDDGEIIIHNGKNNIKNRTVKALLDGYNQSAWAYTAAAKENPSALSYISADTESYLSGKDLGMNRSMMDYYAVSMTVMIMFFGSCLGGASNYSDEHSNHTISRLYASPVSRTAIFFGKIIGSLPMALLQVFTVAFVSTAFYGAHYCDTVKENLLLFTMFICVSLAALTFGMLVNLLFPSLPSSMVLMPLIWIMMFLSGTFTKDIFIEGLSDKLPMYAVQQAAFDLTVFSRGEKALHVTLISIAVFVLLLIIGAVKVGGRRKKA